MYNNRVVNIEFLEDGMRKNNIRLSFNSPVIITFVLICLIVFGLNSLTGGWANRNLFGVYGASLLNIGTYIRVFGHVLGHANWPHYLGNMTLILVIGPMLEEKYGSANIVKLIFINAVVTGVFHMIFFPADILVGASGIVFSFIMLSSFTKTDDDSIPITVILVAFIYFGQELYQSIFIRDNISQISHMLGGAVGLWAGYKLSTKKSSKLF